MVIAGGSKKVPCKGKVGKILDFVYTAKGWRVVVEGVNIRTKTVKPTRPGESARLVQREMPIDISNVMFYSEKLGRPVRLKYRFVDNQKVRGFINPVTKEFEQV